MIRKCIRNLVCLVLLFVLCQCKSDGDNQLLISLTGSHCSANGKPVPMSSLSGLVRGKTNQNKYQSVTVEISEDLKISKLRDAINELSEVGFAEIKVVSSNNKQVSAVVEVALSDGYRIHWQYLTEKIIKSQNSPVHVGYSQEYDIEYVVISIENGEVKLGSEVIPPYVFGALLKKMRSENERVAVDLSVNDGNQAALGLIKILLIIEQERCKAAITIK
jgi:hypothetical protein